jgi:hypothetical protein
MIVMNYSCRAEADIGWIFGWGGGNAAPSGHLGDEYCDCADIAHLGLNNLQLEEKMGRAAGSDALKLLSVSSLSMLPQLLQHLDG